MKITRRQFVSWGLAAGAAIGVQGVGHAFFGHVMRTSSRMDKPVPTVCRACPAGCGIVGYVRGEKVKRLVAIMGNPEHPAGRGKLCALALASLNLHTHPERLREPVIADGQTLSMEAAIAQARQTIDRLVAGGARVVVDTWDERPAHAAFLDTVGEQGGLIGREAIAAHNRVAAMKEVWGTEVRPDFARADLLLVFGANPFEGGPRFIQDVREIVEARVERGAKMIVFDPRLSNTAGRADLWIPIRPGTDHVAALAIARFALEHGENTGFGGSMLRELLKNKLERFALEEAARICGVPAERLADAGRMYVEARAPATTAGNGVFDQPDAVEVYRAIAVLDALSDVMQQAVVARPRAVPQKMIFTPVESEELYGGLEDGTLGDVVLISHRTNPLYERGPAFERALRAGRVVFHLAITPFPNETAQMADLVIPEALPIESSGRVWLNGCSAIPTYARQQPIVAAPDGVWTADEIFRRLAGISTDESEDLDDADFAQIRKLTQARDFVEIGQGILAAAKEYKRTPRYQPRLAVLGQLPLPEPEKPSRHLQLLLHGSSVGNRESAKTKWLAEINHAAPLFVHPDDARRLRLRDGDRVRLSGKLPVGRAGDAQIGFTATVRIFVSDGIRPGCAALSKGQGHRHAGKLAAAKRFKTDLDPDMQLLWWEDEGAGVNLAPFVRPALDGKAKWVAEPPPSIKIEVT